MQQIDQALQWAVDLAWGMPLVVLLVGGGLLLSAVSRLRPLLAWRHAIDILRGKYDDPNDPGDISHFQALSTALAATIGVGNIGGVAIAITQGGPGAVFWMWIAASVGMSTKFFSCTLSQLYRGNDSEGELQGGPMYVIREALGPRWNFLAVFFCTFGMVGCLSLFQTNQLSEILQAAYEVPPVATGIGATALVAVVAFGGVRRIGKVTARLVPAMCLIYLGMAIAIIIARIEVVPEVFATIFREAFTGSAVVGGAAGEGFRQVLLIGVKRAAFSNEAGIGTAPLAHGAAKTDEPVREGLVAMIGPFIDTIVVCTITALVILTSGVDYSGGIAGVSLTLAAIELVLGPAGKILLLVVVSLFAVSTMISYSYYGTKCFAYLFGAERKRFYIYFYLVGLFVGAIWKAQMAINLMDTAFALMAVPNMIATIVLAPKVLEATKDYFERLQAGEAR